MRKTTVWAVASALLVGLAVLPVCCRARPSAIKLKFQRSFQAGFLDVNGKPISATEVMELVGHNGRLFASTSLWKDGDPSTPKASHILVLDSPEGQWRIDHQFTTNNLRVESFKQATFSTDARAKAITPVSVLLAAPNVAVGDYQIFSRDDDAGLWVPMPLGKISLAATFHPSGLHHACARAMGFHRDRVTGVDRVFAGVDVLGTFSGAYDSGVPGRIRWDRKPELVLPTDTRVTAFAECNGELFLATTRRIYRRVDGEPGSWQPVYDVGGEIYIAGIRGLTAVPHPSGKGQVLLFAVKSKVRSLDPVDGLKEAVELDLTVFLTEQLGMRVRSVFAAINEFTPLPLPGSDETVWFFGVEPAFNPDVAQANPAAHLERFVHNDGRVYYLARQARFLIRRTRDGKTSYELGQIEDPENPLLIGVRTFELSPFPADRGRVLYFGGFDSNYGRLFHNTGWIYRAEL